MYLMFRNIYIFVVIIVKLIDWYIGDWDYDENLWNLKFFLFKILKFVIMYIKIKVLKVFLIILFSFEDFFFIMRKMMKICIIELKVLI